MLLDTRTRSDGSFRLKGFEPGESYLVLATEDGYQPAISRPVELGAGETLDLGELVLQTFCRVTGKVVDAAGHPISGATVKRKKPQDTPGSVTDVEGSFALDNVPPGGVSIGAEAPGFVSGLAGPPFSDTGQIFLELRPGEQRDDLVIVLAREGIIRGRIVGPDGAPIVEERFLITARTNQGNLTRGVADTVSENGVFVLSGLDSDRAYDLLVLGLSECRLTRLNVRCGVQDLVFEFQPWPVVRVAVRSEANGALLRPGLVLLRRGAENVCRYTPWTWHDRRKDTPPALVMLPYGEAGTYELTVSREGFVSFESGPIVLDGRSSFGPITALLREESTASGPAITGIVRRAQGGEPLPGVKVSLAGNFLGAGRGLEKLHGVLVTGLSNPLRAMTALTDPDGRFSFAQAAASISLVLKDSRYHTSRLDLEKGSSRHGLELLAYESGAVEGHVTLVNGSAGAGLPIIADRPDAAPRTTQTNTLGEYRLAPLLPGLWYISVGNPHAPESRRFASNSQKWTAPNTLEMSVKVTVPEGQFATADIDLRQLGAALEGTVTVNGLPRISLSVTLTLVGSDPKDLTAQHVAWTGSAGDYAFPGLPPGTYRAAVRSDRGNTVLAETSLSLLRGQVLQHDFNIRLGRLKVTVLEQENGQPIPKAQVTAIRIPGPGEDAPGTSRISARTDANGRAVLLGLTADEFFVSIRTTRGILGRKVTIPPGSTRSLTVHIPLPATLRIILDISGELESELVTVDLHSGGQQLYTHYIMGPLANPTLTLADIQPGEYEIRASSHGGWTGSGDVKVVFGEQNSVTLTLERETASGEGQ